MTILQKDPAQDLITRFEKTLLVLNPAARFGKVAQQWQRQQEKVLGILGRENTEVFFTSPEDHGQKAVRAALRSGVSKVVVIGGDGTISEAIQGFFENGAVISPAATLAVLPSGRGDDFLKSILNGRFLSTQSAWNQGVRLLESGKPKAIDVAQIEWLVKSGAAVVPSSAPATKNYFINIASFAFPGLVVQRVQNKKDFWSNSLIGKSAWTYAMQATLANHVYRPLPVQVKVDGEVLYEGRIHSGYILNGRYNAGGICWDQNAKLDDGFLNVVILDGSSAWKSFKNSTRLALNSGKLPDPTKSRSSGVYSKKGKCIEVLLLPEAHLTHPLFEIDGDLCEPNQTVGARFQVLSKVFSVLSL